MGTAVESWNYCGTTVAAQTYGKAKQK